MFYRSEATEIEFVKKKKVIHDFQNLLLPSSPQNMLIIGMLTDLVNMLCTLVQEKLPSLQPQITVVPKGAGSCL